MNRRLRGRRACRGNLSGVEKLDAPSLRCWMNPELRPSQEGREDHPLPAVKGWAGMHCSTGRFFFSHSSSARRKRQPDSLRGSR